MMKKVKYTVKLRSGKVVEIVCDLYSLKKEILKLENSLPTECLLLFDQQSQKFLTTTDQSFLQSRINRGNFIIDVIDAATILKENNILKQAIDKKNSKIDDQQDWIESNAARIIELENQLEDNRLDFEKQIAVATKTGKLNVEQIYEKHNQDMLRQKQENDNKLQKISQEMQVNETNLNNQIQSYIEKIGALQETIQQIYRENLELQEVNNQLNGQILKLKENSSQIQDQKGQVEQQLQLYKEKLQEQVKLYERHKVLLQDAENKYESELSNLKQKHSKELNDLQQKYSKLLQEKENIDDQLQAQCQTSNKFQQQARMFAQKIKELNEKITDLEEEQAKTYEQNSDRKTIVQDKEKFIRKQQKEVDQLTEDLQTEKNNNQILENYIQQAHSQILQQNLKLKEVQKESMENILLLEKQKNEMQGMIDTQQNQLSSQKNQFEYMSLENKKQSGMMLDLKQQISKLQEDGRNTEKKNVESQHLFLLQKKEIDQLNKTITEQSDRIKQQILDIGKLQGDYRQQAVVLDSTQRDLNFSKQSENELKEQNKTILACCSEQIKDLNLKLENVRAESDFLQQVITTMQENQKEKINCKIIGMMEKIMSSDFKIQNFTKDPNVQMDCSEYYIYEITFDKEKALNYVKNKFQWFHMEECLLSEPLGTITTNRSIHPIAEGTLEKGYLLSIINAQKGEIQNETLLRKELKTQGNQMFATLKEAAKLSVNNLMCKLIQDKFNEDIITTKLTSLTMLIQRQFVLQVKGKKEYFHCEIVSDFGGEYEKINGGQFEIQETLLAQYFNSLSLYSYHLMKEQLVISHLSAVGIYMYDMIISTSIGIFSPIDQGQTEIALTIGTLLKAPKEALKLCYNSELEKLAVKGWQ